jgi:hypothetical protein
MVSRNDESALAEAQGQAGTLGFAENLIWLGVGGTL